MITEPLQMPEQSLERLMGINLDATKTISWLNIFKAVDPSSASDLLNQLGRRCSTTQGLINGPEGASHP